MAKNKKKAKKDKKPTLKKLGDKLASLIDSTLYLESLYQNKKFKELMKSARKLKLDSKELLAAIIRKSEGEQLLAFLLLTQIKGPKSRKYLNQIVPDWLNSSYPKKFFLLRVLSKQREQNWLAKVFAGIDDDWEDVGSLELLEKFAQQRLKKGDTPSFGKSLASMDNWEAQESLDVLKKLPKEISKGFLEELQDFLDEEQKLTDEHTALGRAKKFLRKFSEIIEPKQAETAQDNSPLIPTEALNLTAKQLCTQLAGSTPKSCLLIGEAGVGKSEASFLATQHLIQQGFVIAKTSATRLQAGQSYIGELEERIQKLLNILQKYPVILWVEEFGELAIAGRHKHSQTSILDMLSGSMASGKIRILGETSPAQLETISVESSNLENSMDFFRMPSYPSKQAEELVIKWLKKHRGNGGGVAVKEGALIEAMSFANLFSPNQNLPGSLFNLLKKTLRRVEKDTQKGEIIITKNDFLHTVCEATGIPLELIDDSQKLDLESLTSLFQDRIKGQPEALEALIERITLIKAGLTNPTRPLGIFLFAGPTGTGKTEIAKTLADYLFGSQSRMLRYDMSEFQNPDSLSRLIGKPDAPPCTKTMVSQVRQHPFSLLLLDEFEKAHPRIWDIFLQVFDDGRLTDGKGMTVDMSQTFIILTSNLGASTAQNTPLGFSGNGSKIFQQEEVIKTINQTFRAEFINRLDRIVCFQPLSREVMRDILQNQVEQAFNRRGFLKSRWAIEWDDSATDFLLKKGFSPKMGARPLGRAVERYLLSPLAKAVVNGQLPIDEEALLFVTARMESIQWEFIQNTEPDNILPEPANQNSTPQQSSTSTNRQLILTPKGTRPEAHTLSGKMEALQKLLELEGYYASKQKILATMSEEGFWSRDDRFELLSQAEYIDRVEAMLRNTKGMLERMHELPFEDSRRIALVKKIAAKLHILEHACPDLDQDSCSQILLGVRLTRKNSTKSYTAKQEQARNDFRVHIISMYKKWAKERGMNLQPLLDEPKQAWWIALVDGIGAKQILMPEIGWHIFEENGKNELAKIEVRCTPHEQTNREKSKLPHLAETALKQSPPGTKIIRKYQRNPTPLVKDRAHNWKTGRLDLVLAGHFDLWQSNLVEAEVKAPK